MKLLSYKNRIYRACLLLFILTLTLFMCHSIWVRNPLPADEELIKKFQLHRDDFTEAVRRYRTYPRSPDKDPSLWFTAGDTSDLLKQAGIDGISSAAGVWLPNPNSAETEGKTDNKIRDLESAKVLAQYATLRIKPSPRDRYYSNTLRHVVVWKDFYFFPQAPRVEEGELWWPARGSEMHSMRSRVLPSLNNWPDQWKRFECVYRRIEPQWFLRMCNGH